MSVRVLHLAAITADGNPLDQQVMGDNSTARVWSLAFGWRDASRRLVRPPPVGRNAATHLLAEREISFTFSPSDVARRPEATAMTEKTVQLTCSFKYR